MTTDRAPTGWDWFEDQDGTQLAPDETGLCRAFARCFAGPDGDQVVDHLKRLILDRRLAPSATDTALWHLEGQRSAIAYVLGMIERGAR